MYKDSLKCQPFIEVSYRTFTTRLLIAQLENGITHRDQTTALLAFATHQRNTDDVIPHNTRHTSTDTAQRPAFFLVRYYSLLRTHSPAVRQRTCPATTDTSVYTVRSADLSHHHRHLMAHCKVSGPVPPPQTPQCTL